MLSSLVQRIRKMLTGRAGSACQELAAALASGLISRNGADGWQAFMQRLRKHAPMLHAAWSHACESGRINHAARAFAFFLDKAVSVDIVDEEHPACRAAGRHGNTFVPARMLRALATRYSGAGSCSLLRKFAGAEPGNHVFQAALAQELLYGGEYLHASRAALEAIRLKEYDLCCARIFNDTQKALQDNKLPSAFDGIFVDNAQRFCAAPFVELTYTSVDGDMERIAVAPCACPDWLPVVFEHDLSWNSDDLQLVRASILDGSYRYCNERLCPALRYGQLPLKKDVVDPLLRKVIDDGITELPYPPRSIFLAYDPVCNLGCPSCRGAPWRHSADTARKLDEFMLPRLTELFPGVQLLSLSGSGEALVSRHSRHILKGVTPGKYPDLKVKLFTNLSIVSPHTWATLGESARSIRELQVSVDSVSPQTMEKLRKGLRYERMLDAMTFVKELRTSGALEKVTMCCVVQRDNYKELCDLITFAMTYCVDNIIFLVISYHGSYSLEEFAQINVSDPANRLHNEFLLAVKKAKKFHARLMRQYASHKLVPQILWRLR